MTTQFPDRVLYHDHSWILAWTSGTGLFSRIASLFRHPYSSRRDWNDPSKLLSFHATATESTRSGRRGRTPWSLTTLFHHLFRRTP